MDHNIMITDRAIEELAKLDLGDSKVLRISVIPGGCSGMTYTAAIDEGVGEDDVIVVKNDAVTLIVDAGSAAFLDGLHIDYSDDLIRNGFRFTNPNASGSCGCGASFAG